VSWIRSARAPAVLLRAALYALLLVLVVLYAPDDSPQFVYLGF
jgi:hypothetical protein